MLKNTPSIIACIAALGLVALTIGMVARPPDHLNGWHIGTLVLAWVAVLSSSLATREHTGSADEDEDDDPRPRRETEPPGDAANDPPSQRLPHGSVALVEFARELHANLESDRLRVVIARRLPVLLGIRDLWIVARFGSGQQIIVPPNAGGGALVSDEPRDWSTYPLKADGVTIGLLGIAPPAGGFTERDRRLFKLVASLVAQALSTADAFETLRQTSLVDALTGCATRMEGGRRFEAELRRAGRSESSLAVLMLDLDHFKSVNDRFGHDAGDAVLTAIGETLLTTLRASDIRCRWGGEEFLLVLPDLNVEGAQRASENLRQRIANTPVTIGGRVVYVTASIGLTLSRGRETDIQQLIARADAAMYEAKRLGRNRVAMLAPGAQSVTERAVEAAPPDPLRSHGWNGVERRDPARADRRRVPSPGRRSTDAVLAGRWRER